MPEEHLVRRQHQPSQVLFERVNEADGSKAVPAEERGVGRLGTWVRAHSTSYTATGSSISVNSAAPAEVNSKLLPEQQLAGHISPLIEDAAT